MRNEAEKERKFQTWNCKELWSSTDYETEKLRAIERVSDWTRERDWMRVSDWTSERWNLWRVMGYLHRDLKELWELWVSDWKVLRSLRESDLLLGIVILFFFFFFCYRWLCCVVYMDGLDFRSCNIQYFNLFYLFFLGKIINNNKKLKMKKINYNKVAPSFPPTLFIKKIFPPTISTTFLD